MADDAVIGRVAVAVVPNADNFWRDFKAKTDAQADAAGAEAGRRYSRAFKDAAGTVSVDVDADTAGVREKVAAATRDMHATVKVDADTKPAERKISLLKDSLAAGLLIGPAAIVGGTAAFAGLAAGGLLVQQSIKAIQEQMKAGTPIGKEYTGQVAYLSSAYHDLQGAIAKAVEPQALQSIQILQQGLRDNTPLIAHLAADAAAAVTQLVRGLVDGFHNFAPLLDHVLLAAGGLATKFADWASGPGGARFAHELQTGFDQVLPLIEHLSILVGHIFQASLPLGGGVLGAIDKLAIVLNTFPLPVLQGIIIAFAAYRTFNAASIAINGIKDAWAGLSTVLSKLGIVGAANAEATGVAEAKAREAAAVVAANDRIIASNAETAGSFEAEGAAAGGGGLLGVIRSLAVGVASLVSGPVGIAALAAIADHFLAEWTNPKNFQWLPIQDPFKGSTWSNEWHNAAQDVEALWNKLQGFNDWWDNHLNIFGTKGGSLGNIGQAVQDAYNATLPSGFDALGADLANFNLEVENGANKTNVLNRSMHGITDAASGAGTAVAGLGRALGSIFAGGASGAHNFGNQDPNLFKTQFGSAMFWKQLLVGQALSIPVRQYVGGRFGLPWWLGDAQPGGPPVDINIGAFNKKVEYIGEQIRRLSGLKALPFGDLITKGFDAKYQLIGRTLGYLSRITTTPKANLDDTGFNTVANRIGAKLGLMATVTTDTPIGADPSEFNAVVGGILGTINSLGHGFTIPIYGSVGGGFGFAAGGLAGDPSNWRAPAPTDVMPAMIDPREFIMPAAQTRQHLPELEAMRSGASGGSSMRGVEQRLELIEKALLGPVPAAIGGAVTDGLQSAARQGQLRARTAVRR